MKKKKMSEDEAIEVFRQHHICIMHGTSMVRFGGGNTGRPKEWRCGKCMSEKARTERKRIDEAARVLGFTGGHA